MIRLLTILTFLFASLTATVTTSTAQVSNPYYLVVKRNTISGVEFLRASWKADRRDLTVRNLVTFTGSSTLAGQGASSFDSSVVGRTAKYLDDLMPGAMTWYTFALGGQSARNWIEVGPYVDPVRNVNYAVTYQYNNSGLKEYPKIAVIQDASNWVTDGVSNAINQEYIRSIAAKFVQYGAQVFIVSPQPRDSYTTIQRQQIEDFYFSLVGQYVTSTVQNVRFVKVYDTLVQQPAKTIVSSLSANDGIHLNNAGHNADHFRLRRAIDSVFAISTNILRHEIEVADSEFGPWTSYNNNVHPDTGFVNIPLSYLTKYFRVKTVYTNATQTGWSNIANVGQGPRSLTPIEITTGAFNQHNGFYRFLPDNYPEPGKKYPVIFFLHGAGEKGNGVIGQGLPLVLNEGIPRFLAAGATMEFTVNGIKERFIVLAPQLPGNLPGWTNQWVDPIIDWAKQNLQIDTNRMYLTGLSLGGGGVYTHITASSQNASMWAAAAPVSATCSYSGTCVVANANLPVWMFIDSNDPQVGTQCNRDWVTAVNGCPGLVTPVMEKIYTGLGHSRAAWDHAYDTLHTYQTPNIYEWFLSKSRSSSAPPPPGKVLMGYLTKRAIDPGSACNKLADSAAVYGDNAVLDANDIFYTDATGNTRINGQLYTYGFSPIFNGSVTHALVLGAGPDATHNHAWTFQECNPNQPPQCYAGLNKEITLPINSVVLDGSGSDAEGSVTFSWTKISGPSTFSFSSTTVAAPTVSNLTAGTYTFRITVTDAAGSTCTDDVSILVNPVGTYLKPVLTYDLTNEHGQGRNAYEIDSLFDGKIGNGGWPEKNISLRTYQITGPGESTTPYKRRAGDCQVLDFVGAADPTDLSKKVNITKIEWYDDTYAPDDSCWIYALDPYLALPTAAERFYSLAMPDSLMTPVAVIRVTQGAATGIGWKAINVNINARYLMLRVVGTARNGGGWITSFNPGEMRISGTAYTGTVTAPNFNNAPPFVHTPLKNKIGTNVVTAIDTMFMRTEGAHRTFEAFSWYNDSNVPYPNNKYNADHFLGGNVLAHQAKSLRRLGKFTFTSVRGPSSYILNNQPGAQDARGSAHDFPNSDPVDPLSYKDFGRFALAFANKYGKNKNADVSMWRNNQNWKFDNDTAGTDTYSALEVYNEQENDLNANTSPIAMSAILWMAYDGWENRAGPGFGIKNSGDTTMKLIGGGIIGYDYLWYDALWWLAQFGRNDKKLVVDYINVHHYSSEFELKHHISGTLADLVGTRGVTSERDSVYQKFNKFSARYRSRVPTAKILLSENGRDQWGTPPPDEASASVWTPFSIPPMQGYNTGQAKAVLILRDELIYGAADIDLYCNYWLNAGVLLETTPTTFDNSHSTTGWVQPDEISQTYWIRLFLKRYLGNYRVDSVYNIGADATCLIRWRSVTNPDSLCLSYWYGGLNTASAPVTINVGNIALGSQKITPVFNSEIGSVTAANYSNGNFLGTATVMPQFISYTKTGGPVNVPPNAFAGNDIEITAPVNSVVLNGSASNDPDGTIVTYLWEKISGPSGLIQSPASAITTVIGLTPGTYDYQLTTIDNNGSIDTDVVRVLVNAQPSEPTPDVKIVPLKKPKVIIVVQ